MVHPKVDKWLKFTQQMLLPSSCVLCCRPGYNDLDLCRDCLADLPWNVPSCRLCALPLDPTAARLQVCGHCLYQAPPFHAGLAALRYQGVVPWLVHGFKYGGMLHLGRLLGDLLQRYVSIATIQRPDIIMPVPLASARQRQRGFNQALELARPLAKALDLPLDTATCQRVRHTAPQARQDARHRAANLRGAFALRARPGFTSVALVDDVVTTGHTAAELARTLRRAGVRHIQVWAAVRAP